MFWSACSQLNGASGVLCDLSALMASQCRDSPVPGCIFSIGSTDTELSTLAYVGLS